MLSVQGGRMLIVVMTRANRRSKNQTNTRGCPSFGVGVVAGEVEITFESGLDCSDGVEVR